MSLLGLYGFFIVAEKPLTQLYKHSGMLQIHTCLDINNEFTGEITALLNYHIQQLSRRIVFAKCYYADPSVKRKYVIQGDFSCVDHMRLNIFNGIPFALSVKANRYCI